MMRTMFLAFAFGLMCWALGCGGPTREAQIALTTSAQALRIVDREVAEHYTEAALAARTTGTSWESYDAAMHEWNDVEGALRFAHSTFLLAQDGLDAWRAGDQSRWLDMIPCLVSGVDRLREALAVVGVEIDALTTAVSLVAGFSGPCRIQP